MDFRRAIGAKIGNPDVPVIAISGDGGMQMNIQELATAVSGGDFQSSAVFLIITYLGMVRQWQKLFYGKRYSYDESAIRSACKQKGSR